MSNNNSGKRKRTRRVKGGRAPGLSIAADAAAYAAAAAAADDDELEEERLTCGVRMAADASQRVGFVMFVLSNGATHVSSFPPSFCVSASFRLVLHRIDSVRCARVRRMLDGMRIWCLAGRRRGWVLFRATNTPKD